jgi:hypothetical protein
MARDRNLDRIARPPQIALVAAHLYLRGMQALMG